MKKKYIIAVDTPIPFQGDDKPIRQFAFVLTNTQYNTFEEAEAAVLKRVNSEVIYTIMPIYVIK